MRKRWGYGHGKKTKSAEKETGAILTRFFYRYSGRSGFYRNTLAKCWWVGHNTCNPSNNRNHFESLDIIGSKDFTSKINEFFYNFTFSSNPDIMSAIVEALRRFNEEGNMTVEVDDIDYTNEEVTEAEDFSDVPEVILGCKVVIRNADKKTKTYKYDLINAALPKAVEVFTGHKVGDMLELMGEKWKIEDVIL